MYNFTPQKDLMNAALYLLKKHDLADVSALGGGTALAAYYWNHRYSTDIDIFTHSKQDISLIFRPAKWDSKFKSIMKSLGYQSSKIHPIYTEFLFKDNFRMQFLSVEDKTDNPYNKVSLWGMDLLVESIEEIVAKKIYFRSHKGNARDLFDIAIAIHKDSIILNKLNIPLEKIQELLQTVSIIYEDKKLLEEYIYEINLMNPNPEYKDLATHCIKYLKSFLESYIGSKKLNIVLTNNELLEIEIYSYSEFIEKNN